MSIWLSVGKAFSWEIVNAALQAAGLPEHHELPQPCHGAPWTLEIGGMGCMVHLQRVAAYVALNQGMPAPTLDVEMVWNDPIRLCYYQEFGVDRSEPSAPSLGRARSPFAHLMYHEAEFGDFLPRPLPEMLIAYPPLHDWCQPVGIGSSYALQQECLQLAEHLGLPPEIELEELDRLRRQDDGVVIGSGWRAFALECFVCKALLTGAEISIRSGCALSFG